MRLQLTDDREIVVNGPYPALLDDGNFAEVTEEITIHLSGDGNGFTNRVMGQKRYFNSGGLEVVPEKVQRVKFV